MRAFVTGPFGQDGSYLIEQLRADGAEVYAMVHRHGDDRQAWLSGLAPGVQFVEANLTDQGSVIAAIEQAWPDVIYHLGAISAPAAGWRTPIAMADVTGLGTVRVLEAVRLMSLDHCKVVVAGSIAKHGPYGANKTLSSTMAADYRERGMHVTTLHFGGHHSPRRHHSFFARKVTRGAATIANSLDEHMRPEKLRLGPLDRSQDWMSALDAVRALRLVGEQDVPTGDYVVSTGQPLSSKVWVEQAFAVANLDWKEWVERDNSFTQPTDVPSLTATPTLPGWQHEMGVSRLVHWMVEADRHKP
jgi:GDPmannose 4,6-dehydratase